MPMMKIIRTKLIPVLTCQAPPNEEEFRLLALPARFICITIAIPTDTPSTCNDFLSSTKITKPLGDAVLHQDPRYTEEIISQQLNAKKEVQKQELIKITADQVKNFLSDSLKQSIDLAKKKHALSWL